MKASTKKAIPKRRGRPATGKDASRTFRLSDEFMTNLEAWATANGVTRPVRLEVEALGRAKDPWGGERAGFDLNADVTLRLQNVDNEEDALRKAKVRYRL